MSSVEAEFVRTRRLELGLGFIQIRFLDLEVGNSTSLYMLFEYSYPLFEIKIVVVEIGLKNGSFG